MSTNFSLSSIMMIMLSLTLLFDLIESNPSLILKTGGGKKGESTILFPNQSKCGTPTLIKTSGKRKGKNLFILGNEEKCKKESETHFYPIYHHQEKKEEKQYHEDVSIMPIYLKGGGGYGGGGGGYGGYSGGGGGGYGDYSGGGGGGHTMSYSDNSDPYYAYGSYQYPIIYDYSGYGGYGGGMGHSYYNGGYY